MLQVRALREDVEGKVGPVDAPQPVAVPWAESVHHREGQQEQEPRRSTRWRRAGHRGWWQAGQEQNRTGSGEAQGGKAGRGALVPTHTGALSTLRQPRRELDQSPLARKLPQQCPLGGALLPLLLL